MTPYSQKQRCPAHRLCLIIFVNTTVQRCWSPTCRCKQAANTF